MLKNYLKIAIRNLAKNKGYTAINIGGLAVGMAVAMLIGLWIYDEISFNKGHKNYDRIAQVMQQQTLDGEIKTDFGVPLPLVKTLQNDYGNAFSHIAVTSWLQRHTLTFNNTKFSKLGNFMSPEAAEMLSLKMVKGSSSGLKDPSSILLSESVAKAFFGDADPLDKTMKIDNQMDVKVAGVYEDLPANSQFQYLYFIAPWDLFVSSTDWVKNARDHNEWGNNSFQIFVQLAPNVSLQEISNKIKDSKYINADKNEQKFKPQILLQPMSRWHLYSQWNNGVNQGGRIQFVWLFGIIGMFVLLLACINFMNLSTARSEKRAKEVGIRKAIGSVRGQLVIQFFSESFLVVGVAFILSLLLVQLALPLFNTLADKEMVIRWAHPLFLTSGIGFSLLTGFLAGSYPALYLSSFQPVKVLKGAWSPLGLGGTLPRKILVVLQFTVSITLIIGTIVIYRQILHAKDRPIGYERDGLVTIQVNNQDIHRHFDAVLHDLVKTGTVISLAESVGPPTEVYSANVGFEWNGKDPGLQSEFATIGISHGFGETMGWKFVAGRDFSKSFSTDSTGIVVNETAMKFMGLDHVDANSAIGETVKWDGKSFKILGVVKDMVMESPYDPVKKTIFYIRPWGGTFVTARINPASNVSLAMTNIEAVFKKYSPDSPFNFQFVDQEYDLKFAEEERVGKLAFIFSGLAIIISCLGLFGLSSYLAEQRTKEIGIRKVLGASVGNLWKLLSGDFVFLVALSCLLSTPIAWYAMNNWLGDYAYHTEISWWIFAVSGLGALIITVLTVSFQSVRAALLDPVKSLRSE